MKGFGFMLAVGFCWGWCGFRVDGLGTIRLTVGLWVIRKSIGLFTWWLEIACLGLVLDGGREIIMPIIFHAIVWTLIRIFKM